jgi:hypothetical protein
LPAGSWLSAGESSSKPLPVLTAPLPVAVPLYRPQLRAQRDSAKQVARAVLLAASGAHGALRSLVQEAPPSQRHALLMVRGLHQLLRCLSRPCSLQLCWRVRFGGCSMQGASKGLLAVAGSRGSAPPHCCRLPADRPHAVGPPPASRPPAATAAGRPRGLGAAGWGCCQHGGCCHVSTLPPC